MSAAAAAAMGELNLTGTDRLEPGSKDWVSFALKLFNILLRCLCLSVENNNPERPA